MNLISLAVDDVSTAKIIMKNPHLPRPRLLAAIGVSLTLLGCAGGTQTAQPAQTLLSAGFRVRTPETPEQKEIFAKLPSYKVESLKVKGETFYVYKDEAKGMALVGHEAEYQRYREMARQEMQTEGRDRAMVAGAMDAQNWYGASGADWWR